MNKISNLLFTAFFFTIFFFIWVVWSPETITPFGSSLFSIIAPILSLMLIIKAFRKSFSIQKRFVFICSIGMTCYLAAELIWSHQLLAFSSEGPSFPCYSDFFYFASTVMFTIAFFYYVSASSQQIQFWSFLLDITIIYLTVAGLVMMKLFLPLFKENGFSYVETLFSITHPTLGFLLFISLVICFMYRHDQLQTTTMLLFIFSVFTLVLGDTLFTIFLYKSLFSLESLLEPIWSLNILLFGIAIYHMSSVREKVQIEAKPYKQCFRWNVCRMIIQACCIFTLFFFFTQNKHFFYEFLLYLMIVLVFIRQIISSYFIHSLILSITKMNNELEEKVLERTKQLSTTNKDLFYALEKINYMALHDELTELPNRRALRDHLNNLIKKQKKFTLLFLDVNKFKQVNDSLGHSYGDEMLKVISSLLLSIIGPKGTVFRHSGDEFIIILKTVDLVLIYDTIDTIKKSEHSPVLVIDHSLTISFSVGIAQYPNDAKEIDTIIKVADLNMYKNKKKDYCSQTKDVNHV